MIPRRKPAPIDPDVDLHDPGQRSERAFDPLLLGAIAAGGVLGAEGRYLVGRLLPHAADRVPWATLAINVSGSLLLGALMVVVTERRVHRLVRPFLGVGVLGGYTTFSAASVEVRELIAAGRPLVAYAYLAGSALTALLSVWGGTVLTRTVLGRWQRR